jgi:transcriptional regulator with XRE-family HTH domain
MEAPQCSECGTELLDLGEGPVDCITCAEDGDPKSRIAERIGSNIKELREKAGIDKDSLGARAGLTESAIHLYEEGRREPGLVPSVQLAAALGVAVDELATGVYWFPGAISPPRKRTVVDRVEGFYLTLAPTVSAFDSAPPEPSVAHAREAATILGENVRMARERRHMKQRELAEASGLSKAGLINIELGRTETTMPRIFDLARGLQIPPEVLLNRISWRPAAPPCRTDGRAQSHTRESLDARVRALWAQRRPTAEIAATLGISSGSVSAIVQRLRERGEHLTYRTPPTTALQCGARRRRSPRSPSVVEDEVEVPPSTTPDPEPSKAEIGVRVAANITFHRERAGLSIRQLAQRIEEQPAYIHHTEQSASPRLGLIVRLAASLNVRCEAIAAGLSWEPRLGRLCLGTPTSQLGMDALLERLGRNVQQARRRLDLSQTAVCVSAGMSRSELSALEGGTRAIRFFGVVRLAAVLGIRFEDLFAGIPSWFVLPLPAPEVAPGERGPTKAERDTELVELWRQGRPEREIAASLGLGDNSVGGLISELRDAGVQVPYRRPPRRQVEAAARIRRRAAPGPPSLCDAGRALLRAEQGSGQDGDEGDRHRDEEHGVEAGDDAGSALLRQVDEQGG